MKQYKQTYPGNSLKQIKNRSCRKILPFFLMLAVLNLISLTVCHAQFLWKINGEMGYFNSSAPGFAEDHDILSRLDAQLKYQYSGEEKQALFTFRVRPEFYGFDNKIGTVKFRLSGDYLQDEENFSWGLNLSAQRLEFRDAAYSSGSESFVIAGVVNIWADTLPLSLIPGYAYQLQKSDPLQDQDMDIIFLEANLSRYFSNYFEMNYGAYLEYFSITDHKSFMPSEPRLTSAGGWRAGPQLGLRYVKDFIAEGSYRFLLHNSKETEFPSFEHHLKLLAGKMLLSRFSAFIFVNYYYRGLKNRKDAKTAPIFLYTPVNSENTIYLKLGYDLSSTIESYIKYGYANENLFYKEFSLKGWSLLFGIELNGL
ncbi:MAG: hypothetical protein ACM3Q2_17710 [Syntrophothermus sp.]